ncbi:MAG: 4-alpha-glucanotransferase [Deltaproteobacteria bacterium]|nr:4-alpha-glucanotransferase [Deltaproteobacteria bacterium]
MPNRGSHPLPPRASGILLHVSSLPSPLGIGDVGPEAYRFIDFLADHQQHLWQILPLGPTKSGSFHSPYDTLSAFAGNPFFISPELLVQDSLLPASALHEIPALPEGTVNYAEAHTRKFALFRLASERFTHVASPVQHDAFSDFCERHGWWLDDYACFMALREVNHEQAWFAWEQDFVRRDPATVAKWEAAHAQAIRFHKHLQFFFFTQWERLRTYANQRGVKLVGDIPIYVGLDSAEVWAHPNLFVLDRQTYVPRFVAGVPPDYFSETGQRWGNPLYRWWDEDNRPVTEVYAWWSQRFRAILALVDIVRIDHFRGFEAYWAIPTEEETAINGQWMPGPGTDLFTRVQAELNELPMIAEDLGVITPAVDALRQQFGFPGMKVLLFAFEGDARNPYLPHNYTDPQCVVYTGTHDNDTVQGWFQTLSPHEQLSVLRYLGRTETSDLHWDMIRLALSSIASLAIIPLQDILGLGSEARMNTPAQTQGNWTWRFSPGALSVEAGARLAEMSSLYGRGTR